MVIFHSYVKLPEGNRLQPTSLQKSSHSQVEEFVADPSHAIGESGTQQVPVFLVTGRYGK